MSGSKRQSASACPRRRTVWQGASVARVLLAARGMLATRVSLVALMLLGCVAVAVAADPDTTTYPRREGPELLGADTPIGRLEYVPGRGLTVGRTNLTIGGFTTVAGAWLEGGHGEVQLDNANFFLFWDPLPWVHVFSEIELTRLAEWDTDRAHAHSAPGIDVDRLYVDVGKADILNLRFGRFLTPIGRWNQVLADPPVWTTSAPLVVEDGVDETMRGALP